MSINHSSNLCLMSRIVSFRLYPDARNSFFVGVTSMQTGSYSYVFLCIWSFLQFFKIWVIMLQWFYIYIKSLLARKTNYKPGPNIWKKVKKFSNSKKFYVLFDCYCHQLIQDVYLNIWLILWKFETCWYS